MGVPNEFIRMAVKKSVPLRPDAVKLLVACERPHRSLNYRMLQEFKRALPLGNYNHQDE